MAYVKTGFTARFSGKAKRRLGAGGAAVALLLVLALVLAVCPRGLFLLLTTDKAYTEYVTAKALSEMLEETEDLQEFLGKEGSYQATGGVTANLTTYGQNELGGERAGAGFASYLASTRLNLEYNRKDGNSQWSVDWTDPDGSVLSVQRKDLGASAYLNIANLETGWMQVKEASQSNKKDQLNKIYSKADSTVKRRFLKAVKTGYQSVNKDISYGVSKNMELQVEDKTVTGTRCHILIDAATLEQWINVTCNTLKEDSKLRTAINKTQSKTEQLSEAEYEALVETLRSLAQSVLEKTETQKVSLEFYVNRKNEAVGMTCMAQSNVEDLMVSGIRSATEGGMALLVRVGSSDLLQASVTPAADKDDSGTAHLQLGKTETTITYSNLEWEDGKLLGRITADNFVLPGKEDQGGVALELVSSENKDGSVALGASLNSETLGSLVFNLTVTEGSATTVAAPDQKDIAAYDKEETATALVEYFLKDLPKQSSSYNNMYKNIINGIYQNLLTAAFLKGGASA